MRHLALLALLLLASCPSTPDGDVYDYHESAERNAVVRARQAAQDVGVPLEPYADLWDVRADPSKRERLADQLEAELERRAAEPEDIAHVSRAIWSMLHFQVFPRKHEDSE